jgi:alcohol dehydrogenase class IV
VLFEFATATRIVFGAGSVREVPAAVRTMGSRVLLVTGASPERAEPVLAGLRAANIACAAFSVAGEPTVDTARSGVAFARAESCDVIVSCGGGSAIDAGKAIAALLTNSGDALDYLEVIGRAQPLEQPPAPFIAIPTTAGTGAEVTRNAVLAAPEQRVKASLRCAAMLPRLAIVDPELTYGLPPAITAATGLDALTQLIEPYVSTRANPMTDLFCKEGIRRVAGALKNAFVSGHADARRDMSWGSLLGGLALANAGLGAVHGFAAPIGGMFPAPHGAICAAVLPHGFAVNVAALRARQAGSPALQRFEEVARLVTGRTQATAEDAIAWINDLCRVLEIPRLQTHGVTSAAAGEICEKAAKASSMKANPIELTKDELHEILERSM